MKQTLPSIMLCLALFFIQLMSVQAQSCTVGAPCDDNDICTINDVFDEDCNCVGDIRSSGIDTDGDGTDDCFDFCPNDSLKIFPGACGCGNLETDTDGDLTPDCFDLCPNDPNKVLAGVCGCGNSDEDTDGDTVADCIDLCPNTTNNVDSDGDGVCDDFDICPFGDDNLDTNNNGTPDACEGCDPVVGTPCDDGNACTINDIIVAQCDCMGIILDSDGDTVCDADDICPGGDDMMDDDGDGIPNFCDNEDCNPPVGTPCDDGDDCSTNDVITGDCMCMGTTQDSDGDGICDALDICAGGNDNMDSDGDGIPDFCDECNIVAGTMCDDGNVCTVDDRFDANCNCEGTFADSDGDGVCDSEDVCAGGNDNMDSDGDGIPDFCDDNNCAFEAGTPCDDGNVCTINDVYDMNCNCAGTFADSDGDGVCDSEDICAGGNDNMDSDGDGIPDFCDDNNCAFEAGTPCDDGNVCTINDVYDMNCNCAGTFADSDGDGVCDSEDICAGGNDNMDSDGDGIPDFCDDNNCAFEAGTPCDDGNVCTINDVYDMNCNCAGTFADSDGDGVCDSEDICVGGNDNMDSDGDGIPDFCDDNNCAFEVGTPCDDGDICTINDAYNVHCDCVGIYQDGDLDGVCDGEDICPGGSDFTDENHNGIPDFCDECPTCEVDLEVACRNDIVETLAEGETAVHIDLAFPEVQLEGCPACEEEDIEGLIFLGTFEGHRYFVSEGRTTWYDAKSHSETLGGYLAVIGSERENHFLTTHINDLMNISSAFIGLHDIVAEGHLAWLNGESLGYTNWLRPLEDMNSDFYNAGRWLNIGQWDMEYELITRPYIIEIPCVTVQQLSGPTDGIYTAGTTKVTLLLKSLCGGEATCSYNVQVNDSDDLLVSPSADVLRFYALKKMEGVQIEWLTNLGFKTHHFVLEHSTDNEHFSVLKNIVNVDFSNTPVGHQTWDKHPQKGQNYYRLRQVFKDGSSRLTTVQKVVYGFDLEEFFIFPNPVSDKLGINLRGLEGEAATIRVFNTLGHQLDVLKIEKITKAPVQLEVSDYLDGVYNLTIQLEKRKLLTRRFVVQR